MSLHRLEGQYINGVPVHIDGNGLFTVFINTERVTDTTWERLLASIEENAQEKAEKAERRKQLAAAPRPNDTVWIWNNGNLIKATYRGRHQRTRESLLTINGKKESRSYVTLYIDLTEAQVAEASRLNKAKEDASNAISGSLSKVVKDGSLYTKAKGFALEIGQRRTFSGPTDLVATIDFQVTSDHRFQAVFNDETITAKSFDALAKKVIRRLHPHYGQPVWVVSKRSEVRGPEAFKGTVTDHTEDGEHFTDIKVFTDEDDANEYVRLNEVADQAQRDFKAFTDTLRQYGQE